MILNLLALLIRIGAAIVNAYHVATVIAAEAVLSAVADLAEYLPGDNAEQRLASFVLACVGGLALTTMIAVLAVALGVCL